MSRAVIFDIEGTIGDIAFVRDVLFPFARVRTLAFLSQNWDAPALSAILGEARAASGLALATPGDAARQFIAWIDEDRKITPLKSLQGLIWREGYESGELRGHLYPDAIDAMRCWHGQGKRLYIYSSGSIAAQKLYLAYSVAGDLTPLLSGHFDTTTGAKGEASSYRLILDSTGTAPGDTVFFSDSPAETAAARAAGLQACRIDRAAAPGFHDTTGVEPVAGSFMPLMGQY